MSGYSFVGLQERGPGTFGWEKGGEWQAGSGLMI